MAHKWVWVATAVVIVAGAALYYQATLPPLVPAIVTVPVSRGTIVETVEATGTLQAVKTVQVGTQVSGTIKALHADFNTRVHRGQIIAELDPALFETQVEQARASLARLESDGQRAVVQLDDARRKLTRAQTLAAQGLISASDLEAAEVDVRMAEASWRGMQAQVEQARASLHQGEVNLEHTVITAPIDGIVISRNVDVGQTVAASMQAPTLFVLARDLNAMQVNASIAESDIGRITAGQGVTFHVDAYPRDVFRGTVSQVRLQPVVEQNVVSYVTIIDVPNPDLRLKPGMTATVSVVIARAESVLQVPNAALRIRPTPDTLAVVGETSWSSRRVQTSGQHDETSGAVGDGERRRHGEVWVLLDGRLARVEVETGITDGLRTAVVGPELEGAAVVTSIATSATPASTTTTSPLLPVRGRGSRGQGGGVRP